VKTFASRLKHAREHLGISQVELANRAGISPGSIGNYEAGFREMPRNILKLATALGVNPMWLQDGKLPIRQDSPTQNAHSVSLEDVKLSSQLIEWEVVRMKAKLPEAFKVAAPDDSMAPRLKAGQIAEFEVGLELRPGDGVLVRDAEGEPCIRRCRRVQGEWQAYAEDGDNHLPFMIGPDQLLAVLVGVHARWG
jgi:transcriptional regulator with XRE-family HTH domain